MDFRVEISGWGCIVLAMLCLILPLDWMAAVFLAAVIHEGCHILSVVLLGGRILSLRLTAAGAELVSSPMPLQKALLSILAGPAGSLGLLLLRELAPQMALCGLGQGLFNLLPVYPLDGGRALHLLCSGLAAERTGRRIENTAMFLTVTLLLGAGLWGTFDAGLGKAPAALSFVFLLTVIKIKISCKEGILRVQ